MTVSTLCRRSVFLAPAIALAVLRASAATPPAADKTVFLAVLDAAGLPVRDLTMEDVRVREDGVDREIVSVKPATQPLQIALLADTTQSADTLIRDVRT